MMDTPQINLALVDDHKLFRKGLVGLTLEEINHPVNIIFEADNRRGYAKINAEALPEIILMDINMPYMDGFQSVGWLNENFPGIKVLVVSMVESEEVL